MSVLLKQTKISFSLSWLSPGPHLPDKQKRMRTVTGRYRYSISSLFCLLPDLLPCSKKPASLNNTEALLKPGVEAGQKKDHLLLIARLERERVLRS